MNAFIEILIAGMICAAVVVPLAHMIEKWKKEMDESE
jgi:hypothetical protein